MVCRSPSSLIMMVAKLEKKFNKAANRTNRADREIRKEWIPPPEDCYKINVDATYCNATKEAKLGNCRSKVSFLVVTKGDIKSPLQA